MEFSGVLRQRPDIAKECNEGLVRGMHPKKICYRRKLGCKC
jgi:hypothetical protein